MTTATLETAARALAPNHWNDLGEAYQAELVNVASSVLASIVTPTPDTLERLRVSFDGRISTEDARKLYRHVMAALIGGDDVIERLAGGEG